MNGWQQEVLEQAVAECLSPSGEVMECGVFDHYTVEEMQQCKVDFMDIEEDVVGPMPKLPGCNPVQDGPVRAQKSTCGEEPPKAPEPPKEDEEEEEGSEIEAPEGAPELVHIDEGFATVTPTTEAVPTTTAPPAPPILSTTTPEPIAEEEDKPVNPYLVIVTETIYTTIDVYETPAPEPPAMRKRHGHHKLGKRHGGF